MCTFRNKTWYSEYGYHYNGMTTDFYECRVVSGEILTLDDATITSLLGTHMINKRNPDVVSFDIEYMQINYFPKKLIHHFANLKSIRIKDSKLKRVIEEDVKPFLDLRVLCFSGNEIQSIGEGTFKHNTELEYLSLDRNSIQFVEHGAFANLKVLGALLIQYNVCINDHSWYSAEKKKQVISNIEKSCNVVKN